MVINRITLLLFIGLAFWSCEDANDTGNEVLTEDCAGITGGNAVLDNCGVCDDNADNDCTQDCAGNWGGSAVLDNCDVCDDNADNDCTEDCTGIWGGENICGCTDPDATNYNSEATVDDGSCEYSPANVIGSETGMSYNQGSESASMSYRLNNTGGATAYNVQYRLRIQYKCITGFSGQGWTSEFLPSSSSLYTYGDIPAGYYVDFTDNVGLCSGLGIEQFTFEVYQVIWD